MKLGERLVRDGKLTRGQLAKALKMQGLLGGRLGTTLVDESLVDEDAILGALGRQHSTRTVSGAELGDVPPEVVRMIPARLAGRYGIVPFHLKGRTLSVASKDAGDLLKEDEIGFLTSCMVKTCIGLEFRIDEALERYYRVRAPDRNRALVRRLAMRAAAPAAPGAQPTHGPPARSPAPQPRSPAIPPRSPQPRPPTPQPRPPSSDARPPSAPAPPPGRLPAPAPTPAITPSPAAAAPAAAAAPRAAPQPVEPQRFIELDEEDAALLGTSSTEIPAWTPPSDEPVMLESAPLPWLSRTSAQDAPQDQGAVAAAAAAAVEPAAVQPMPAAAGEAPAVTDEEELDLGERLHRAAAELRDVEIRDDIGDVLLGFCAPFFKRRAILVTRKEQIVGWRGEGEDIEEAKVRAIDIHAHDPSVFLGLTATGSFWLGALPKLEANQILVDGLGGTFPRDCVVLPVTLRSRVVCYLYGDNLEGGVGGAPIAELRRLAAKAGLAFEVYILKNKLRLL